MVGILAFCTNVTRSRSLFTKSFSFAFSYFASPLIFFMPRFGMVDPHVSRANGTGLHLFITSRVRGEHTYITIDESKNQRAKAMDR